MPREDFVILTAHRRENLGEGIENVFLAVKELSEEKAIKIIYPIHKNEKILQIAERIFSKNGNVKIIPPLSACDFHNFLSHCKFVITDSGGVQEEASFLGKPVLVARKCTERKELLSNSVVKIVGNNKNAILSEAKTLIDDKEYYKKRAVPTSVFGSGNASKKIAGYINRILKEEKRA